MFNDEFKDVVLIVGLSILGALEALVLIAHVCSFIPIHWNVPIPPGLELERESFLYVLFLTMAFGMMIAAMRWIRPVLSSGENRLLWRRFCVVEAFWVCCQLFVFFKWISYRYPFYQVLPYENGGWVMPVFYGLVVLSTLSKIFWPEVNQFFVVFYPRFCAFVPTWTMRCLGYAAVPIGLVLLLLPNAGDVVALGLVWDQFNHWDDYLLTRTLVGSGLGYPGMVLAVYALIVVYWSFVFLLIDRWLKSFYGALFGVLVGIKLSMFHQGMAPVALAFPGALFSFPSLDPLTWQGLGNVPMFDALRVRQFFSFFMGFLIPVFYAMTLLNAKDLPARLIAGIGFLTYFGYIIRPTFFAYGGVGLPVVLLLCYWVVQLSRKFFARHAKAVVAFLALAAFFALVTNRLFVTYPHAINMYGQDFSKERAYMTRMFDVSKEADLITRLIPADDKVVLISSFETAILAKARRQPLLKDAPIMISASEGRVAPLRIKTKAGLLEVINTIDKALPEYIFMEQIIWALPDQLRANYPGLFILIDWAKTHYEPQFQGGKILALKRKMI